MNCVLVLFGSNIEPAAHFRAVQREFEGCEDIRAWRASSVYESPAVTVSGEIDLTRPLFHNAVFTLETILERPDLRQRLREIERILGRRRTDDKFADRTVDLDILGYRVGSSLDEADPVIQTQAFAAVPAAEVAPDCTLLPRNKTLAELALEFDSENTMIRRTL